jgi:hypothetical protein
MPLDPTFDNDDSQPWSQMGPPLRITVHPASPANSQANNSATAQGIESDGYPNDWIEADGYPSDWIVPATARSAPQGIDNRTAPAKAATGGSVPYGSIESDGYPNDWIEQDGYPSDWIVPASARLAPQSIDNRTAPAKAATGGSVPYGSIEPDGYPNDWIETDGYPDDWIVPGQTRTPGTGFLGTGRPSASYSTSRLGLPQPQPQTAYGGSDAARPGDRAIPAAFQQQPPSTWVVPVSDQAGTQPGWIPLGPGSGWEPWADHFIKGMQGLINQFRSRSGGGAPRGGDGEDCYDRWEREDARCKQFLPFQDKRYFGACKDRASVRRDLCIRNGGRPDPAEPREYDWRDIP